MEIYAAGTFPTKQAPADAFTGTVWHDPIVDAPPPARIRANRVTFEPGARTAWHTHPLGQTLHVILGVGRVWIPPGEKHWHGAAPSTGMVHIAMQEALDGTHVTWLEHVTDEQYRVSPET
jgi:quercetin dioxygenase-like cupin family protein